MRVSELIEYLEGMQELYGDAEVRLACQPTRPFAYSVCNATIDPVTASGPVVYIAEDRQLGYLPESVKEEIGW